MIDPRKEASEVVELMEVARKHGVNAVIKINSAGNNTAGVEDLSKLYLLLGEIRVKLKNTLRTVSEQEN